MKSSIKKTPLSIIMIPIVILLGGSIYFAYTNAKEYAKIYHLSHTLNNMQKLIHIESAIYDEILCSIQSTAKSLNTNESCAKSRNNTNILFSKKIKENQSNQLFSTQRNWLFTPPEKSKINFSKLEKIIHDIRYDFDINQNKEAIDYIKGNYQKKLLHPIKEFLNRSSHITLTDKQRNSLSLLNKLNILFYTTEQENTLVTYYLSFKKPINENDLNYWDNLISSSTIPDISSENYPKDIIQSIDKFFSTESMKKNFETIENNRIEILSNYTNGNYPITLIQWQKPITNKITTLVSSIDTLLNNIKTSVSQSLSTIEKNLFLMLILVLLSLLFLIYLFFYIRKIRKEDKALERVVIGIDRLSTLSDSAQANIPLMPKNLKDKESIYEYIDAILQLLHKKEKEANEANEAKSLFLANMSHEIRTPLNGISGFSQLLKETPLNKDQLEFVSIIDSSASHLVNIVNDILDISKITAEKMDLEYISFNIHEVINSVIDLFSNRAIQKDIILGIDMDPSIPHYIIGDPTKLSQVLTNLVSNAIKFTKPYGTIDIFIKKSNTTQDKISLSFAVKDSGIGIPEDKISTIFEAFSQADSSTSRQHGGTGLGLTIASKIISLMGGELDIHSQLGHGTEFFFTISLQIDQSKKAINYPSFKDIHVGLALPMVGIDRQTDKNLKNYITFLGASFSVYYYDDIFDTTNTDITWPDLMIIDHHYATLKNELEHLSSLPCKTTLLTTHILKPRIISDIHHFSDIQYTPINLDKTIHILENFSNTMNTSKINTFSKTEHKIFPNKKVLVAEDNTTNQKLMEKILEKYQLDISIVSDGEKAVDAYKNDLYDLILMDIQMPIMSGLQATQKIREIEKDENKHKIPIIALTANVSSEDRTNYLNGGMDDYLTKPFKKEILEAILEKYLIQNETLPQKTNTDTTKKDSSKSSLTPQQVLIYTRSPLAGKIYESILAKEGFSIDTSHNEDHMLEMLAKNTYQFTIMDRSTITMDSLLIANYISDSKSIPIAVDADTNDSLYEGFNVLSLENLNLTHFHTIFFEKETS